MKYLVLEKNVSTIVDREHLWDWLRHIDGNCRIFRLCGLNSPIELYRHGDLIMDRYGNIEEV